MGCSSCSKGPDGLPRGCRNNGRCGSCGCGSKTVFNWLEGLAIPESDQATCAIVLAAAGYPESPRKGDAIQVADDLHAGSSWLIHAGTKTEDSTLKTSGGRVAAVVSKGKTPEHARTGAYDAIKHVRFDGAQYRQDIGNHKEI